MEDFLAGERPIDFVENDFQYILDSGVFQNVPLADNLDGLHSNHIVDLWEDPLLSDQFPYDNYDECLSPAPHMIKSDHSYSMANEPDSPFFKTIKVEPEDYESDAIHDLPLSPELSQPLSLVKKEIINFSDDYCDMDISSRIQQFVMKEPLKPHLKPKPTQNTMVIGHMTKHDVPHLKFELLSSLDDECGSDNVDLPPTPPSSTPSDDSEGGNSPQRCCLSEPGSPVPYHSPIKKHESRTTAITAHMFTNLQRLPPSGPMVLTDEEKRTLVAEGYPIPTDLPLTKAEEKALKKVRRKIKNKISAQESRRKKKEYVEALEKRMESYTHENGELRKKVDNLETTNESLAQQLERLQAIVSKISRPIKASATQTGTCLMVLVLCFAVFLGSWSPHSLNSSNIFSKSVSPSSSLPKPLPYDPVNFQYNNNLGERSAPVFGPEEDQYATPSRHSSRLLMSVDEDDDCSNSLHNPYMSYKGDGGIPSVYQQPTLPDGPNPNDYTTREHILGSVATGSAIQLQASMHPDIQVEVPVDTLANINRSSNK